MSGIASPGSWLPLMLQVHIAIGFFAIAAAIGPAAAQGGAMKTAYDFRFEAIEGKPLPLADYRGKVLLVVNTASFCGFTPQYKGLQALAERYEAKGLVVIGVPSNDFGAQEPNSESEIKTFCEGAFGITFPLTTKQTVKGPGAHPFYAWARDTLGEKGAPRWNFHKYLVGADGRLAGHFSSRDEPLSPQIIEAVEREIARRR